MVTKTIEAAKTIWQTVAVTSLTPDQAKLYKTVQDAMAVNAKAYKALKAAEDACTAAMLQGQTAPTGKMFKVAFRYGLAIAMVDAETVKAKTGTLSLADYLAQQAA